MMPAEIIGAIAASKIVTCSVVPLPPRRRTKMRNISAGPRRSL
jgi:hypothetical protein